MNHEVFKIGRSGMIRLYQLFKNKQIKILQVQQLKIQNYITFTTVKLTRRVLPLQVHTRQGYFHRGPHQPCDCLQRAGVTPGENKFVTPDITSFTQSKTGQAQVTQISLHLLLRSRSHYSRFTLYRDHCSGPEQEQCVNQHLVQCLSSDHGVLIL